MTGTRQNLSQQVKGRGGRAIDKAWAQRMLLLRRGDTLSCNAALDDPTGALQNRLESQGTTLGPAPNHALDDAAAAKKVLEEMVTAAARPATNRLYRTVCRQWKEGGC